ncbi:17109_t:CDS:2, partial [Gigaspora rosea]
VDILISQSGSPTIAGLGVSKLIDEFPDKDVSFRCRPFFDRKHEYLLLMEFDQNIHKT